MGGMYIAYLNIKLMSDGILLFVRNRVQKRYANRIDNIFTRNASDWFMRYVKETSHDLTIFL